MEGSSTVDVLLHPWKEHGLHILIAACGWTFVQLAFLPFVSKYLPNDPKGKPGANGTMVSAMVHAIVACSLALYSLLEPNSPVVEDHVFATSDRARWTLIISSG